MQNIQLPEDQFRKLSAVAQAAGYQDVSAFIASFVDEPVKDPRGNVADAQLRENVAAMGQRPGKGRGQAPLLGG